MIKRKTGAGILILTTLVIGSYWATGTQKEQQQAPIAGLDTRFDYALQDFEMKFYDIEGRPSVYLNAPALTNDAVSGESKVSKPAFEVIHHGNLWNIVAESATVAADHELIKLSGEVRMHRVATAQAGSLDINTSELTLEVTPKKANSDQAVRLVDGNDIMEAVGFRIDMIDNRLQLLDQVKLTYAVNE